MFNMFIRPEIRIMAYNSKCVIYFYTVNGFVSAVQTDTCRKFRVL